MYYLSNQETVDLATAILCTLMLVYVSWDFCGWRLGLLVSVVVPGLVSIVGLPEYEQVPATLQYVTSTHVVYQLKDESVVRIKYSETGKKLDKQVLLHRRK